MADSDDEYDRKRRDKFRGERESYRTERRDERRPIGGAGGGRDEWSERNPFRGGGAGGGGAPRHRPDYSDYRGPGPRARYGSPVRDMPPPKRMRSDWGDGDGRPGPRYGGYDPYLMQAWTDHYQSMHSAYHHASHPPPVRELPIIGGDTLTQPAMLNLKQFLDTQDENISDSEVMRKYTEYKTDFKRQQLNEFFVAHKDEEWFKNKYHPEDSVNRSEEQRGFLRRRTDVFVELLENGTIGSVKVDSSHGDALIRVLDTCVIKLEGGTDEDLKVLDEKPKEALVFDRKPESVDPTTVVENTPKSPKKEKEEDELPLIVSPQRIALKPVNSDDENWDDAEVEDAPPKKPEEEEPKVSEPIPEIKQKQKKEKKKKIKKRKRNSSSDEESSSSESESSSSSSEEEEEDDEKLKAKYDVEDGLRAEQKAEAEKDQAEAAKAKLGSVSPKEEISPEKSAADPEVEGEAKEDGKQAEKSPKSDDEKKQENGDAAKVESAAEPATGDAQGEVKPVTIDLDKVNPPRAMHRTSSIFLRNLAPSITKAEIEALCSRFSGYLRTAIADPLVERRWYRRGWITFTRDVNIKEICWSLNNQRLRDCEMGAIVNRDLSRRVRPANGITAHKQVVRSDIKLCARIVMNLDEKFKLWSEGPLSKPSPASDSEATAANGSGSSYGFNSKNPVLQNITDYLIEEASAEEEELLGLSGDRKDGEGEPIERDEQLLSVLDRLVLYLRIVHSVDYYNHCEYPYEDEMPNRCGIIHARGPAPSRVTSNELNEYIKSYEGKLLQFLTKTALLSEDQIKDLGAKNADTEVEKFVQANTQELAKDKWLCPLSGKKFKGPEFIRKHIFNKHEEKVDEVRKEVQYFNNYLRDPKRPQLPEHPGSVKRPETESVRGPGGYRPPMYTPMSGMPYSFGGHMMGGGRGGRHFPPARRPGGFDYRSHRSHYRDLDAPQEPY
ncbi:serrate RNA effector molecule homolog isoform X2 [Drosophila pseudoobscura]|uniref:Serrate RNA effector molecule homolog n=1 Tax=Drosophila pseudoobscura pseudoobscura TaxID=46245 RepID=A0A6I8VGD5_DROPS|nr:serrate RNA effector molecule homolog isoform X2 [Drosophila pseudoobscura]